MNKLSYIIILLDTDMCLLNQDITAYHFVSQGKTTIPGVDDGAEMQATDVSFAGFEK